MPLNMLIMQRWNVAGALQRPKGIFLKAKVPNMQEEIPAEVIAESIELAKKQQEAQRTEPTSSELALFNEVEAEHSAVVP
ncbi:hypothetical protein L3X38_015399 [Prunus dulcis]|uniref:Uncharacterized protein n=1 Tax=Prunus dulcis TaxID=3755 RepID=A0AAD4WQ32_PRUDU|nr:hypothetical protein L3X38_015399 [Prunus dulcis]